MTQISRSRGSSPSRERSCPSGMWVAPGTLSAASSNTSRKSSRSPSPSASRCTTGMGIREEIGLLVVVVTEALQGLFTGADPGGRGTEQADDRRALRAADPATSKRVTSKPRWTRFSVVSRPMKPLPITTARVFGRVA
jgi:hypothetical protein